MAGKRKYDSGADSVLMSEEDYNRIEQYKQDFANAQQAGNQAGMQAAHDAAEALREQYNYSGGADGSEYISLGKQNQSTTAKLPSRAQAMVPFTYEAAPQYTSKYQEQINQLMGQILNRPDFSYDPASDPSYQAFRKEYQREGQRAAADTMGQMAAMTGGMPSTAAVTAAQQAGDYYAAQMADRIPELYQLAYSMYQDEGSNLRRDLDMLTALEQGDYNQYLNLLAQYNTDRDFAYGVYADAWDRNYQLDRDQVNDTRYDMEWNYGVGRDELEDQRYEDETAYNRGQTSRVEAQNRIYDYLLNQGGSVAGLDADLITQSGYTSAELAAMEAQYQANAAAAAAAAAARAPSGNNANLTKPRLTLAQALDAIEEERVTDAVVAAYDYYMGEGAYDAAYGSAYTPSESVQRQIGMLEQMRGRKGSETAIANSIVALGEAGRITMDDAEYMLEHFGYNPRDYIDYE